MQEKRKRITAHSLVECWRGVKSNPDAVINTGDWTSPQWTSAQFRRWFNCCLADKINAHDPRYPRGRKAGEEYTTELTALASIHRQPNCHRLGCPDSRAG